MHCLELHINLLREILPILEPRPEEKEPTLVLDHASKQKFLLTFDSMSAQFSTDHNNDVVVLYMWWDETCGSFTFREVIPDYRLLQIVGRIIAVLSSADYEDDNLDKELSAILDETPRPLEEYASHIHDDAHAEA